MKNLVIVGFPAKKDKFEELKNTLKEALVDTRAFEEIGRASCRERV